MTSAAAMPTSTQRPKAFCSPAFSVIVDDVDARATEERDDRDSHDMLHKLLTDTSLDLRYCSKDEAQARIRQIQVEAESRKLEFARLLEEHAQVIRKLKQMEEVGAALSATNA